MKVLQIRNGISVLFSFMKVLIPYGLEVCNCLRSEDFSFFASKIAISIKYKTTASSSSSAISRARNNVVSREYEAAGCFDNILPRMVPVNPI